MKFRVKETLFCLLIFFSFSVVSAQEDWECGLTDSPLIEMDVSVWSSKKGFLKNLTYKDFKVYDEDIFHEVEFFKEFDELKNQYTIGFHSKIYSPSDYEWHEVKIKVKLSKEQKKEYGKIVVKAQNGYYPNRK